MKKIVVILLLMVPSFYTAAQKKNETWWTMYAGAHILPADVYVTEKSPHAGIGSGHTLLFRSSKQSNVRVWLGGDFNHHYFGVRQVGDFRVFYENWQLAFVTRFSFTNQSRITPFADIAAGGRYLVSFTTNDRNYAGIIFRRFFDLTDERDNPDFYDYKIIREYGKFNPFVSLSGGFVVKTKSSDHRGFTLKGSLNLGTKTRFVDRRYILTETDTYYYPLNNGSGLFFNVQLGYSFE